MARVGTGSLTEISRRIARRLGRSPETVRYTIKNYDRSIPSRRLFPEVTGPLTPVPSKQIFNSFRRGISVDSLAKRFQRTRSSMYRVINEIRAQRLLEQPRGVHLPTRRSTTRPWRPVIEADMPDLEGLRGEPAADARPQGRAAGAGVALRGAAPNKEQEQHLFRKMNFLKFKAPQAARKLKLPSGKINYALASQDLEQIESLWPRPTTIKDRLINCNMRLVVAIAKRHAGQAENFFELLSDGNMSLIRAVEKFDYSRGNKFSTYAELGDHEELRPQHPGGEAPPGTLRHRQRGMFDAAPDTRTNEHEIWLPRNRPAQRPRLLEHLEPREREIIRMRAGLDSDAKKGLTLEKIGEKLGITKERVRQLNVRAMRKLRGLVEQQKQEL